jgi:hypothetical protein
MSLELARVNGPRRLRRTARGRRRAFAGAGNNVLNGYRRRCCARMRSRQRAIDLVEDNAGAAWRQSMERGERSFAIRETVAWVMGQKGNEHHSTFSHSPLPSPNLATKDRRTTCRHRGLLRKWQRFKVGIIRLPSLPSLQWRTFSPETSSPGLFRRCRMQAPNRA